MIRRSLAFAVSDKVVGALVAIGTMAVVSRILTPAEIGLFLVASSLVILIEAFRDFGVAACIIQERNLTPALVRTAFTIMALLSLSLGGAICLAAGQIAAFFGDPQIAWMIRIASIGFLLAPFSNPILALLRRDMAFGSVAVISIATAITNAMLSIGLALAGLGAFSLVWGALGAAFVNAAGALIVRPDPSIFRPTLAEWRKVVPFGFWTTVVTLLGMAFDSFPRLILGRLLGFTAVGLFGRALSLSQITERTVLSAVQPVILSDFAARVRAEESLSSRYLTALGLIASLQWPALACLAVLADPMVRLLLGPQWLEVVPLLRIVSVAGIALFPSTLAFPVLISTGKIRDMAIVSFILFCLSMTILFCASQISLMAVAWSLMLVNPLQGGGMLLAVRRHVPFAWGAFGRMLLGCVVVCLATVLSPVLVVLAEGPALGVVATALAVAGAVLGWWIGLVLTANPIAAEISQAVSARLTSLTRPGSSAA